jgi:hypothetical protein
MDYPPPGIATLKAISQMCLRCPRVQYLSPQEAIEISEAVANAPIHFDKCSDYICEIISKFKAIPYTT